MHNHFNKQNKRHSSLFSWDAALEWKEDSLNWLPYFDIRSEPLNKRIAKISPRRGKKEANKVKDSILGIKEPLTNELWEFFAGNE